MLRWIAVFLLISTPALAQQIPTVAQRLQSAVAGLIGENAELANRLDQSSLEIQTLRRQLQELKDAQQISSAGSPNGGSCTQPEVR